MSDKESTTPTPSSAAEQYLQAQLLKTKKTLRTSKIVATVMVLFIFSYMTFLTTSLGSYLQPKTAAEIILSETQGFIQEQSGALTARLEKDIPEFITELPEWVLRQLPEYRAVIQMEATNFVANYCKDSSVELGKMIDDFIEENKTDIQEFLKGAQDELLIKQIAKEIEDDLVKFVKEQEIGDAKIGDKITATLGTLKRSKKLAEHYAKGKDLTAEELRVRHAIYLLLDKAAWSVQEPGGTNKPTIKRPAPKNGKSNGKK